jgi:hypothetical protein
VGGDFPNYIAVLQTFFEEVTVYYPERQSALEIDFPN